MGFVVSLFCRKKVYLSLGLLMWFSLFSHVVIAELAKTRVFVLAGQSNMQGRGASSDLPEHLRTQPENVRYYTHGRESTIAKYHYFGPEVNFAYLVSKIFPNDTVIIIKSAATGSSISQWQPDDELYKALIRQVKYAVGSGDADIQGIVWMQGEADARDQTLAENYQTHLEVFFTSLRKDLQAEDTAIMLGQIKQPNNNFVYEKQVRQAQQQIAEADKNVLLITTDDLGKLYDNVHYNSEGLIELGRRFALGFVEHRKQKLTAVSEEAPAVKDE